MTFFLTARNVASTSNCLIVENPYVASQLIIVEVKTMPSWLLHAFFPLLRQALRQSIFQDYIARRTILHVRQSSAWLDRSKELTGVSWLCFLTGAGLLSNYNKNGKAQTQENTFSLKNFLCKLQILFKISQPLKQKLAQHCEFALHFACTCCLQEQPQMHHP